MASSPDSTDTYKAKEEDEETDKEESPPAPPPPSKSQSPPSSPPIQSPSTPDSSAPPPSNPSPPPPKKSPPPPPTKSPPPPESPPSPPPPPPSRSPSHSPPPFSPPPPTTTYYTTPPSPPPKEDSPTPSPPQNSKSSPSSSQSPPPSNSSPQSEQSSLSSSSPLSPPSDSSPRSEQTIVLPPASSYSSTLQPLPPSSASSSLLKFYPPPTHPSYSPPSTDSVPSPPADSPTSSLAALKTPSVSVSPAPNLTGNSFVNFTDVSPEQTARLGVAFGVVSAVLVVGFVLAIIVVYRHRTKRNRYYSTYISPSAFDPSPDPGFPLTKRSPNGGDFTSPDTAGICNSKTWFSYEELATATDGFDSKHIIGSGGFGCVYKGFLPDGKQVAIKKLKDKSGQGDREFRAEVEIISRVHHRHLVTLVGYCIVDEQRLLVYEFVPNNTLYHHLHAANKSPMNWALRVRVACGSARGIAYLHEDCNPRIIHRDIKSANILLTNSFEAEVSDFGLAKLARELESNTHVSTRVMGTFGYMAPEYATSGKLTEKSDVFSFGVVLLELITGRKSVDDSRPIGDESLVEWARPLMSEALETENFDRLADSRLEGDYDRGEMFRMTEAAAACVRHSASKRPRMSQVVRALDTMGDLTNGVKPGESEIMNSREQSAQLRMFQRMTFESQDYSSENHTSQDYTSENYNNQSSRATIGGMKSGALRS